MSVEIKKKVKGNVSFGDTSKIQIEGIGTILISYKDGGHKLIDEVYYVPKLKSNILSLGQLLEKEYYIHMKNLHLWLRYSNNNLIAKVYMAKNRLFPLNLKIIDAKCLKANVQDDSWCWHMQFGHLNFEALKLWETRTWLMEFHQLTIPTSSVKLVFLEYMQGGVFRRRPHEEQLSHVNLFTWMYVDRLIHLLLVKVNISCPLLMILVERLGYSS